MSSRQPRHALYFFNIALRVLTGAAVYAAYLRSWLYATIAAALLISLLLARWALRFGHSPAGSGKHIRRESTQNMDSARLPAP